MTENSVAQRNTQYLGSGVQNSPEVTKEKNNDDLIHSNEEKTKEFIGHISQAPAYARDNIYIHTGYRINFNTPLKVLKR